MWCIKNSKGEFWSNQWGWGSKKGCEIFVLREGVTLPLGGQWARYR